jgi:serine/threonine-protein kinase
MTQSGQIISLRLASYELQQQIAASTYGEVWHAVSDTGTQVALKLVNRARMMQQAVELHPFWLRAAHKEILFLRTLSPWDERHIVRLIDDGVHEALPVMALELMASDLYRHLQRQPKTPFARCLHWLAQINQALAKVHQCGWRYLDLKPGNLLLSHDLQTLKLADFGTGHRIGQGLLVNKAHGYRGTANWQAPEQFFPASVENDEAMYVTTAQTDYFALGALFYYLVTGGLPLRFCSLCGQSFASHQVQGAITLRQSAPLTLYPDEEQLFMKMIDADQEKDQEDAQPNPPSQLARTALEFLKQLLAAQPQQRPAHALAIARQIDALLHQTTLLARYSCQRQESAHISSTPRSACQPSSRAARSALA